MMYCPEPSVALVVAMWLIVALLVTIIVLAIWSEWRRTRARSRRDRGVFEATRTVRAIGLSPAQHSELSQILATDGIEAVQRRIDEMKYE